MKKKWIPLLILVVLIGLAVAGCKVTRSGYESAPYQVVRADGKFQVRDYPALTVVETLMAGSRNGNDGSFMRLFGFITGKNEAKQKIVMTTPVFMSGGETNATMAFVLSAKLKSGAVPQPSDGTVTVRELAQFLGGGVLYSFGLRQRLEILIPIETVSAGSIPATRTVDLSMNEPKRISGVSFTFNRAADKTSACSMTPPFGNRRIQRRACVYAPASLSSKAKKLCFQITVASGIHEKT